MEWSCLGKDLDSFCSLSSLLRNLKAFFFSLLFCMGSCVLAANSVCLLRVLAISQLDLFLPKFFPAKFTIIYMGFSIFLVKVPFLALFETERGVAI